MGLQLVRSVPRLHCLQEELSLGLQLALEVPRLHCLQEELSLGLQLALEVPRLHCLQEDLSLGLQLVREVPRLHQLQEELHVEELNGAHLEALEVQQNEAQHHHHRHLEVFLRATLHTPEGNRAHHLQEEICLGPQLVREVPREH